MTIDAMILLLPIALFLSMLGSIDLTEPLKPASDFLHARCINWFSEPQTPHNLSASFICGQKVTQTAQRELLQKSGIYHAIVVSGGHFLFLESLLKRTLLPYSLRMLILLAYYLLTGLQAPGLRCLIQMNLGGLCERANLKLNQTSLCFYSGIICLIVSFPLWHSMSFWLSFVVSMALCHAQDLAPSRRFLVRFFLPLACIYLFLIPFNFTIGYTHPLNLILGALLVFPFCALLCVSAFLVSLNHLFHCDFLSSLNSILTEHLMIVLRKWTLIMPAKNHGAPQFFFFWVYAFGLITAFYLITIYYRRETVRE